MRDVEVRQSVIEGLGIFATRSFNAGEQIRKINVVREITPECPLREDLGERQDHCDYPDGKVAGNAQEDSNGNSYSTRAVQWLDYAHTKQRTQEDK
jgi:hypothetical protein